jgi:hypothetical protein
MIRFEEDWQECADPHRMLDYLEGKLSDRKLRLFACACVRRYWGRLHTRARQAVEVSERFADALATAAQLDEAREAAELAQYTVTEFDAPALFAAVAAAMDPAREAARQTLGALRRLAWSDGAYEGVPGVDERQAARESADEEARAQCDVARHVFGDPFHPVAVDPLWLRWDNAIVHKVAQIIYTERRFDQLPILADALEEAGCGDERLLLHFRRPGEHERGCWALDLLLNRG